MRRLKDQLANGAFLALVGFGRLFPYRWRIPLTGWIVAHLLAPIAGYRQRVRDNLAHVCPQLSKAETERLARAVPDNLGRTLAEIYSGEEFIRRVKDIPLEGPGAEALLAARAEGRPVILATGHFGNYDVARAALIARGFRVGALYRPMSNKAFDAHYVRAISRIGTPLFAQDRHGMSEMVRFVRSGGMLGILIDQYMESGAALTFLGKPARTATSAADLALRYHADLIPIYAVRAENGLDFAIHVQAPIAPSSPQAMTQALNDSLETLVRAHMGQWFWVHRRWKNATEPR